MRQARVSVERPGREIDELRRHVADSFRVVAMDKSMNNATRASSLASSGARLSGNARAGLAFRVSPFGVPLELVQMAGFQGPDPNVGLVLRIVLDDLGEER